MNGFGGYSGSWVIRLLIINVVIFIVQWFVLRAIDIPIPSFLPAGSFDDVPSNVTNFTQLFGVTPVLIYSKYFVWQIFTYMFLHGNFMHLFMNMYALLIFGLPIEQAWGSRRFLIYYLLTGVGAGVCIFSLNAFLGLSNPYMSYMSKVSTIGASGAVFGILLAFGILYPNTEILLFFFIPIKAKYLVMLYGGLEVYWLVTSMGGSAGYSSVSHIGHVGGLLTGILYFLFMKKRQFPFRTKLVQNKFQRQVEKKDVPGPASRQDEAKELIGILKKVRIAGPNSLSDDEFQFLRYKEIMAQHNPSICAEQDFDSDDLHCGKCESLEACALREIRKYMM